MTGGDLVRYGDAADMRRGSALLGHNPGASDYFGPGDTAPFIKAAADASADGGKPHFFDDGKSVVTADPSDPSGFSRKTVGGVDPRDALYGKGDADQSAMVLSQLSEKARRGEPLSPQEQDAYAFHYQRVFPNDQKITVGDTEYLTSKNPESASRFPTVSDVFGGRGPVLPSSSPVPVAPPQMGGSVPTFAQMPPISAGPVPVETRRSANPTPTTSSDRPSPLMPPPGALAVGPGNAPTEGQSKAYSYATSMVTAEPILRKFDGTNVPSTLAGVLAALGNQNVAAQQVYSSLRTQEERDFFDAAYQFITGKLRWESGATINPSEFATAFPTLFPMPGDSPERVAHKQLNRERIIKTQMGSMQPAQRPNVEQFMREDGLTLSGPAGPQPAAGGTGAYDTPYGTVTIRPKSGG
jgi:hypothetical protein